MNPEDRMQESSRKIRVRTHGGRSQKPYSRPKRKLDEPQPSLPGTYESQGVISKVASYVLPSWLSNWFSGQKDEKIEYVSSSSEEDSDADSEVEEDNNEIEEDNNDAVSSHQHNIGNHVISPIISSTPMITRQDSQSNSEPSIVLVSTRMDPGLGSSRNADNVDDAHQKESITTESETTSCGAERTRTILQRANDRTHTSQPDQIGYSFEKRKFQFTPKPNTTSFPQPFTHSVNRPSFKVSSFISSRSNIFPSTKISPFYTGMTSFGGSSGIKQTVHKRQKISPVASASQTTRTQIRPKSFCSKQQGTVTSDTARKILSALDRMSSPVQDVSRFRASSGNNTIFSPLRQKRNLTARNEKLTSYRSEANTPPTRSLSSERPISIQQSRNTSTFNEPHKIEFPSSEKRPPISVSTFRTKGLPTSFSPEDGKVGGKMKRQRTTGHYSTAVEIEEEESINAFPEVSNISPLVINSLPKINFGSLIEGSKTSETSKYSAGSCPSFGLKSTLVRKGSNDSTGLPKEVTASTQNNSVAPASVIFNFAPPSTVNKKVGSSDGNNDVNFTFRSPIKKASDSGSVGTSVNTSNTGRNQLVNKFSPSTGSWECSTCLLRNKETDNSCVACGSFKPKSKQSQTSVAAFKSSPFENQKVQSLSSTQISKGAVSGKLAMTFASPPPGSWECETCLIRNKSEDTKCVACQSARSTNTSNSKMAEKSKSIVDFKAKFAPNSGSWECDACMVRNDGTKQTCVACGTSKPSGKPSVSQVDHKTTKSLKAKFLPPSDSWECDACMVRNDKGKETCAACGTSHSKEKTTQMAQKSAEILKLNFAAPSNSWECDACMIMNGKDKSVCAACGTAKPGTGKPVQSGTSQNLFTASSNNLTFGASSAVPQFKFGQSDNDSAIKFGSSSSQNDNKSIQFGVATNASFKFGTSTTVDQKNKISQPHFQFGSSGNTSKQPSEEKQSTKLSVASKLSSNPAPEKKEEFSTIADAAKAGFLNVPGVNPIKDNSSFKPSGFLFSPTSSVHTFNGPIEEPAPQTKPTFGGFGDNTEDNNANKLQNKTGVSSFNFGAPSAINAKPSFDLNAQLTNASETNSISSSPFKSLPSANSSASTTTASNVTSLFGQPSQANKETAAFQFGQTISNTFGGNNFSQSSDSSWKSSLGKGTLSNNQNTSDASTFKEFNFGNGGPGSETNLFGNKSTSNTNSFDTTQGPGSLLDSSKFQFGQTASKPTNAPALFNLGSTNSSVMPASTQNTLPTFSFNATSSTSKISQLPGATPPFQFTAKSTDSTGGFNFNTSQGMSNKVSNPSTGGFNFNPDPTKLQFGQQKPSVNPTEPNSLSAVSTNSPFNFSGKTSETFGDSSSNTKAVPLQPTFNFTGNQQNTFPTSSFNFGGTSNPAGNTPNMFASAESVVPPQTTGFNFTAKQANGTEAPMFNFMGNQGSGAAPPTFSANSPSTGRKFKRAVRRHPRK